MEDKNLHRFSELFNAYCININIHSVCCGHEHGDATR